MSGRLQSELAKNRQVIDLYVVLRADSVECERLLPRNVYEQLHRSRGLVTRNKPTSATCVLGSDQTSLNSTTVARPRRRVLATFLDERVTMSRTHTPAAAFFVSHAGRSDLGPGEDLGQANTTAPYDSFKVVDLLALREKAMADVVISLDGVDLLHELDVGQFTSKLDQLLLSADDDGWTSVRVLDTDAGSVETQGMHTERHMVAMSGDALSSAIQAAQAHQPGGILRAALAKVNRGFAKAMGNFGLAPEAIEAIDKWQTIVRETSNAQHALMQQRQMLELTERIEKLQEQSAQLMAALQERQTSVPVTFAPAGVVQQSDPMEGLSAAVMGERLGKLSAVTVRKREQEGALFSVLASGRTRGRLYPAFQAWEGIVGEPLRAVLGALRDAGAASGSTAHVFFSGVTDLLGNLTPVEVLLGRLLTTRSIDFAVMSLLESPPAERLAAVIKAAKAHAGSSAA